MKSALALLLTGLVAQGQTLNILEKGAHHRVMQVTQVEEVNGEMREKKFKYLELANGMHYFDGNDWVEAQPTFAETPEGFVLTQAQYQLSLAADMMDPTVVTYTTPDGKRFRSNPGFLAYRDTATGQAVAIAEVKSTQGRIQGGSEVYFDDCFDNLRASIRVKASREGMEQDVLLEGDIPTPQDFGLNAASTQLEMWSEFLESPTPDQVKLRDAGGLPDIQLEFGVTTIGQGHAFMAQNSDVKLPVAKRFGPVEGFNSTFLVEVVRYPEAQPLIDNLQANAQRNPDKIRQMAAKAKAKSDRQLVASRTAKRHDQASLRKKRQDQAAISPARNAFVIDYSTVTGNFTNMVFDASLTTYVSGNVSLYTNGAPGAATIFEGGTVIKFISGGTASLTINGPVDFRTTQWRPLTITAKDDHTIGETLGSGSLANSPYANIALNFNMSGATAGAVAKHVRILKAKTGIAINGRNDNEFWHIQMVDCDVGFAPTTTQFSLRNALFFNVTNVFVGATATGRVEHLTVDKATWFNKNSLITLLATNSLLTQVANLGTYTAQNVTTLGSGTGIYKTAGAGSHYLADSSPYRRAGTTGIHSTLAGDLKKRTTYAPEELSGRITLDTTLRQKVLRGTGLPDLGFSYVPIDWALAVTVTNASLTIAEGVTVVGTGNSAGVWVHDGGKLIAKGRADRRIHLSRYGLFQENPTAWGTGHSPGYQLVVAANYNSGVGPEIQLIHCDGDAASGHGAHVWSGDAPYDGKKLWVQNCEFNGAGAVFGGASSGTVGITNNLFIRSSLAYQGLSSLGSYNNLTYGGEYLLARPSGAGAWTFKDNHLHATFVTDVGLAIVAGTNAYSAGSDTFNAPTAWDVVTNSFTFESGVLSSFYQPTSSLFVNKGSQTNATYVGMYHFTSHSNQTKEALSHLDMGYHVTATSGSVLADSDGDGIPDAVEDANGSGTYDAAQGETDWSVYTPSLGSSSGPGLITFTLLK